MQTIILGAGGHARVIIDILMEIDNLYGGGIWLLDDAVPIGAKIDGCPVIGEIAECVKYKDNAKFVFGIGNNRTREKLAEKFALPYLTLIHPSAVVGRNVEIGEGSVVVAGAVINCGTRIGKHCIINTGATVDHDNCIRDFVHISPGVHLGGMVEIGDRSWVGIGGCVKNNVVICEDVLVGVGGVVVKDIVEAGTYLGVPAKKIKR